MDNIRPSKKRDLRCVLHPAPLAPRVENNKSFPISFIIDVLGSGDSEDESGSGSGSGSDAEEGDGDGLFADSASDAFSDSDDEDRATAQQGGGGDDLFDDGQHHLNLLSPM